MAANRVIDLIHPELLHNLDAYNLWRSAYHGGDRFVQVYLSKFGKFEDDNDFALRKRMAICPAFAKSAINEVKNSIFQRIADVQRVGGPDSYQRAVRGLDMGVDIKGNSMASFIGKVVLPELITMGKVGLYLDAPEATGNETLAERGALHPYLYCYGVEDIQSWLWDESSRPYEFQALLLRDNFFVSADASGVSNSPSALPSALSQRYRHMWREDGKVYVQFYSASGVMTDRDGNRTDKPQVLNIKSIPFVVLQLSDSLMSDISRYQVALMNLASSDMQAALRTGFPLYTEMFDPIATSDFMRPPGDGTSAGAQGASSKVIAIGPASGRAYAKGLERPQFINPSSEPLKASMELQAQMKRDIKQLINLAVSSLEPRAASAESKQMDSSGLESGLSYIGIELAFGESRIAELWSEYDGGTPATIHYPKNYSIKSDAERREEATALAKIMDSVPSSSFQRNLAKQIAAITLGTKVSPDELNQIFTEIDEAPAVVSGSESLVQDVQAGMLSLDTASKIRGYPDGEVEKAAGEHADRVARIQAAQTPKASPGADPGPRGAPDLSADPNAAKNEKAQSRDTTTDTVPTDKTRGPGK